MNCFCSFYLLQFRIQSNVAIIRLNFNGNCVNDFNAPQKLPKSVFLCVKKPLQSYFKKLSIYVIPSKYWNIIQIQSFLSWWLPFSHSSFIFYAIPFLIATDKHKWRTCAYFSLSISCLYFLCTCLDDFFRYGQLRKS